MARASIARHGAIVLAGLLAGLLAGPLAGPLAGMFSTCVGLSAALAQEAPPGFAPADVRTLMQAWPFSDPAFARPDAAKGTGGAEATVKALADEIAYSARFVPATPAPLIANEAAERPPPDTTLWPEAIAAETFARPAARADGALWTLDGRRDRAQHEANAAALDALIGAAEGAAPGEVAFLWPNRSDAVRTAARPLVATLEQRLRQRIGTAQCTEPEMCAVMDAVQKKAAADAATSPIEDAVADFFFEAVKTGVYADSTAGQRAFSADRAAQRRALRLAAPRGTATAVALPWDMKLLVSFAAGAVRQIDPPASSWPLGFTTAALDSVRRARTEALRETDLDGVAVTHYGRAVTGADGIYELAAALTFIDASARRQSYSLVLRFRVDERQIEVLDADVAAIAPAHPRVHVAFVPVGAVTREQLTTTDAFALLRSGLNNGAERRPGGEAQPYYALAYLLHATPPAAQAALRVSAAPHGLGGYPGMPVVLDLGGWRVVAQRATFALGTAPPFYFKTLYRPSPADMPVLIDTTSTFPDAAAGTAATAAAKPAAALANRLAAQ